METPALYIHLADDGGILAIDSATGRSMWIGLREMKRRLSLVRADDGSVLLSRELGSRLAEQAFDLIRSAGLPIVESPEVHPDAIRCGGATTLMSFSYGGAAELVEELARRGATLEAEDEEGFTALTYAANAGQEEVVGVLIRAGADVSHRDHEGSAPLMFAAQHGHLRVVKKLLVAGAEVNARRTDGLTAYDFALRNHHDRVASVLMSAAGLAL